MKLNKFFIFILLFFLFLSETFWTYNEEFKDKWVITDWISINKSNGWIWVGDEIIINKPSIDENKIINISKDLNVEWGFWKPADTNYLIMRIIQIMKFTIILIILWLFIWLGIVSLLFILHISNIEKNTFYKWVIIKIIIALLFFSWFAIPTYLWVIKNAENSVKSKTQQNFDWVNIKLIK